MANEATPLQAPRQAKAAPEKVTQVVGQVMEQARELSRDAKDLRPALANRVKFWFLAPDSVPVHGLLDWLGFYGLEVRTPSPGLHGPTGPAHLNPSTAQGHGSLFFLGPPSTFSIQCGLAVDCCLGRTC